MKLTYWCARQETDASCYNIRTKTKRECIAEVAALPHIEYSKPFKVDVKYRDAFDLMARCMSEDRPYEYPVD